MACLCGLSKKIIVTCNDALIMSPDYCFHCLALMIVSEPWFGCLLSRIQKHFPQPKRRRTLPPAPEGRGQNEEGMAEVAVEEAAVEEAAVEEEAVEEAAVEEEGHDDELPELPEEVSAWPDDEVKQEEESAEAGQEQHEEVEQEEEGVEDKQEEEGVEAFQEQHEEVEQEEEGPEDCEEQEAVEVEVECLVGEDEMQEGGGDGGGAGDEWSDFSSRDPVLMLSLFGAVCFRACGMIVLVT